MGRAARLSGHSRVPPPPAMITAYIRSILRAAARRRPGIDRASTAPTRRFDDHPRGPRPAARDDDRAARGHARSDAGRVDGRRRGRGPRPRPARRPSRSEPPPTCGTRTLRTERTRTGALGRPPPRRGPRPIARRRSLPGLDRPVFLVGAARSGTTFLGEGIGRTPRGQLPPRAGRDQGRRALRLRRDSGATAARSWFFRHGLPLAAPRRARRRPAVRREDAHQRASCCRSSTGRSRTRSSSTSSATAATSRAHICRSRGCARTSRGLGRARARRLPVRAVGAVLGRARSGAPSSRPDERRAAHDLGLAPVRRGGPRRRPRRWAPTAIWSCATST